MPGIWLDDATFQQTAGQIWAQQQIQNVQAGQDWANQAIQASMQKLQSMVPSVTPPAPPAPAPTPGLPTPTEAAPPPLVETPPATPPPAPIPPPTPPPTPVSTPPPDLSGMGLPSSAAMPAPPSPPPELPSVPTPAPTPTPTPGVSPSSLADAGESWAQQQINNLLNPSPAGQQTPSAPPGLPTPTGGAPPPGGQQGAPATTPAGDQTGPLDRQAVINYVQQRAADFGVDPAAALAVAQQEGLNTAPGSSWTIPGEKGPSFGPASWYSGGAGGPILAAHGGDAAAASNWAWSPPGLDEWLRQVGQAASGLTGSDAVKAIVTGFERPAAPGPEISRAQDAYSQFVGGAQQAAGGVQNAIGQAAGALGNAVQQAVTTGQTAVNTAVQGVQSAVARVSQFGMGLSSGDAMAFCGPAAAMAFAQTYGRNPTVDEAKQLAQQVGWNASQGMAGVSSEVKLLNAMGVDAHATQGVDWQQVAQDASGGNPVIIDTPGHYYYVDGANQQTGQLHVGTSGTDLKGGSEWMTPDQINAMPQSQGSARSAIFADHPLAQSDGSAQAVGDTSRSLNIGPLSIPLPGPGQSPQPMPGQPGGLVTPPGQYNPAPGSLLPSLPAMPTLAGPATDALQSKAHDISQAVLNVGGGTAADLGDLSQNLLQGDGNVLGPLATNVSRAPQSLSDVLTQNALLGQGIPTVSQGITGPDLSALGGLAPLTNALTGLPGAVGGIGGLPNPLTSTTAAGAANTLSGLPGLSSAGLSSAGVGTGVGSLLQPATSALNNLSNLPAQLGGMSPQVASAAGQILESALGLPGATPPAIPGGQAMTNLLANVPLPMVGGALSDLSAPLTGLGAAANVIEQQRQQQLNADLGIPAQFAQNVQAARTGDWGSLASGSLALAQRALEPIVGGPSADLSPAVSAGLQAAGYPQGLSNVLGQAANIGAGLGVERGAPLALGGVESLARDVAPEVQQLLLSRQPGMAEVNFALGGVPQALGLGGTGPLADMAAAANLDPVEAALNPVTWGERLRALQSGVISDPATVAKVGMSSAINPAWSFLTRGAADIAGATPLGRLPVVDIQPGEALGRAYGSVLGAQTSWANVGDALARGFSDVMNRPTSIAARADNPIDRLFGQATQFPAALHSMLQQVGQEALTQIEIGRMAGETVGGQYRPGSPEFINAVGDLIANPTQDMLDQAQAVAKRAVLRGDAGEMLGQRFANLAGQGPGTPGYGHYSIGNALFPVFRVGWNSLTQGLEKSPLGLLGTVYDVTRAATPLGRLVGEGPYAGGAFQQPIEAAVSPLSERFTNNVFGTALTTYLAAQAINGNITGDGPADPGYRQVLEDSGWQRNSINIPGIGYVSYRGTPFETQLALAGSIGDALHNPLSDREQQQQVTQTLAERLLFGTMNSLADRTGLETMGQISDLLHGLASDAPTALRQFVTSEPAQIAGSYVPMSGLLRGIERMTDPLVRQAPPGDFGAAIGRNIPGWAETVQPRLDILGQPLANPQQGPGAVLPWRLGPGQPNAILSAYQRSGVGVGPAPQKIDYGPYQEIYLSDQERQTWQQLRGQILDQSLARVTADPSFQGTDPSSLRNQQFTLNLVDRMATNATNLEMISALGPSAGTRAVAKPGSLIAPIQSYGPGANNFDAMNAMLSGQTGLQALEQSGTLRQQQMAATLMQSQMENQALMQALLSGQ